jgi:hypothetical protein
MPRYEYICNCDEEQKSYTVRLSFSEYKSEIPCPCGKGLAVRKFSDVSVLHGLTANEKKFGSNKNRKDMAEYVKDQRDVRKKSYDPDSREANTNELWTGKEGLDGITSLPVDKKVKKYE